MVLIFFLLSLFGRVFPGFFDVLRETHVGKPMRNSAKKEENGVSRFFFENVTLVARRREHLRIFLEIFPVAQLSPKRSLLVHKNSLAACHFFKENKCAAGKTYKTKCAAGRIFRLSPDRYSVLLIQHVILFSQITAQNLLLFIFSWFILWINSLID